MGYVPAVLHSILRLDFILAEHETLGSYLWWPKIVRFGSNKNESCYFMSFCCTCK